MVRTSAQGRLTAVTKLAIVSVILVNFSLLEPFDLSDNSFARIFTTFRVIAYFSLFVILFYVLQRKVKITDVPGLGIIFVLLLSMAFSTYIAGGGGDAWLAFGKALTFATWSVLAASILRSFEAVKTLLKWSMYVTIVFVVISVFHLLSLRDVLPSSSSAGVLAHMIAGQTTIEYSFSPGVISRGSSLWLDANNFGYIVASQIVYLVYLIVAERPKRITMLTRYLLLALFTVAIVRTLSRGSVIAVLIGVGLFLFFAMGGMSNKLKVFIRVAGAATLILVGITFAASQVPELSQRFFLATGLLGNSQAADVMSGLETGRLITAEIAYKQFLQKPILGWGSGKELGAIWTGATGNHLGYLDILGHYGIVGLTLTMAFLGVVLYRFRHSLAYLKLHREHDVYLGYCLAGILGVLFISEFFRVVNMINAVVPALAFYLAVSESRKNLAGIGSPR